MKAENFSANNEDDDEKGSDSHKGESGWQFNWDEGLLGMIGKAEKNDDDDEEEEESDDGVKPAKKRGSFLSRLAESFSGDDKEDKEKSDDNVAADQPVHEPVAESVSSESEAEVEGTEFDETVVVETALGESTEPENVEVHEQEEPVDAALADEVLPDESAWEAEETTGTAETSQAEVPHNETIEAVPVEQLHDEGSESEAAPTVEPEPASTTANRAPHVAETGSAGTYYGGSTDPYLRYRLESEQRRLHAAQSRQRRRLHYTNQQTKKLDKQEKASQKRIEALEYTTNNVKSTTEVAGSQAEKIVESRKPEPEKIPLASQPEQILYTREASTETDGHVAKPEVVIRDINGEIIAEKTAAVAAQEKAAELLIDKQAELEKVQYKEVDFERRHEVRDTESSTVQLPDSVPEYEERARYDVAARAAMSGAMGLSDNERSADNPKTPQPPSEKSENSNMYRQAVTTGFITAVIILVILFIMLVTR